jgi:hypothetical protein
MRFLVQECTPSRSSNTGLDGITALRWPLRWNNRIEQTDFDQVKPVANGFVVGNAFPPGNHRDYKGSIALIRTLIRLWSPLRQESFSTLPESPTLSGAAHARSHCGVVVGDGRAKLGERNCCD